MPQFPLRPVEVASEARTRYDAWLAGIDRELDDPACDRNLLCRRVLEALYLPGGRPDPATLSPGQAVLLDQLDPRNVTLEPEYYHEIDLERYARVKPLLWMWEMFDRSPAGENVALGIPFRRLLARRIFRRCGRNFKAFPFVRFSFGYNMDVGDDVVIHRHVLLDDRGGIRVGNRASVSDFANVYSHTHDIRDPKEVSTPVTVLGEGVRITYHATILAGVHVADDSMVGALALATRDTEPSTVHVGIPARPITKKPDRPVPPGPRDPLAEDSGPGSA